jgi:hypothetical protein
MENTNEKIKITSSEISEIIKEHKTKTNKDLIIALEFIKKDFELTKDSLLRLSSHLDKLESSYNALLKEYQSRNGR